MYVLLRILTGRMLGRSSQQNRIEKMPQENHPNGSAHMARLVGQLEGKMTHIEETMKAMLRKLEDIDETLSPLQRDVSAMKPVVNDLEGQMKRVLPVIEDVKRWRNLGAGVILALVIVGSFFSDAVIQAKSKLVSLFFGG